MWDDCVGWNIHGNCTTQWNGDNRIWDIGNGDLKSDCQERWSLSSKLFIPLFQAKGTTVPSNAVIIVKDSNARQNAPSQIAALLHVIPIWPTAWMLISFAVLHINNLRKIGQVHLRCGSHSSKSNPGRGKTRSYDWLYNELARLSTQVPFSVPMTYNANNSQRSQIDKATGPSSRETASTRIAT